MRARRASSSPKPAGLPEPPRLPALRLPALRLLALDAAGASCSAAVWAEGALRARACEAMARGQSERLVPMIEEVMARAGLAYADLEAIAVTRGPGGFTGVRIGLATARGLGLALGRPVLGVTSFEALAAGAPAPQAAGEIRVAVIDAKRAEVYVQAFRDGGPLGPGRACLPEALDEALPPGPLRLLGDGAALAAPALRAAGRSVAVAQPADPCLAAEVARLAAARPLPEAGAPPPGPLYLRGADVTLPDGRKLEAPG